MKKRTASALKWIGLAVIALAVLYAMLLGASNRSLRRAYAALESDGRPLRAEQIIPARISGTANSALIYEAVALQLKAEPAGDQDLFKQLSDLAVRILAGYKVNMLPDPQAEDEFGQFSQKKVVSAMLAALARGAGKPGCRYDVDYTRGAGVLLPHALDLRNLSRILCATARLQAGSGDHAAGWGTVLTGLHLANALRNEPLLISQLVRIAQFRLATDTIHALAANSYPSDQQYENIESLLKGFEDVTPFVAAMDGERLLLGEWAFNLPRSELRETVEDCGGPQYYVALGRFLPPLLRRDHAAYLTVMRAYARNAAAPYSARDAAVEVELMDNVPQYCVLTRFLTPALLKAKGLYVSMVARARVTRAGLAVLRYRRNKGTYPAALHALNLNDLVDPFTGEALAYHSSPSDAVMYSIGQNLVDDKGTTSEKNHGGDIVWRHSEAANPAPEN